MDSFEPHIVRYQGTRSQQFDGEKIVVKSSAKKPNRSIATHFRGGLVWVAIACTALCQGATTASENQFLPLYVGSEACKGCHQKEYDNFITYAKKSTSFQSIERLRKELTAEEIRGCFYCHTTGFGQPGGFVSEQETPHLKNAGCEVCHGPGGSHVRTKDPQDISGQLTAKDCEACHISERVKAFRYKPLIRGGAH